MNLPSRLAAIAFMGCVALVLQPRNAHAPPAAAAVPNPAPTFYRDVLPILQQHCQRCHRAGEIGPMPLVTFEEAHTKAQKIAVKVRGKQMPPWFADPCCGHFSNDPSITPQ